MILLYIYIYIYIYILVQVKGSLSLTAGAGLIVSGNCFSLVFNFIFKIRMYEYL